MYIYLYMHTYIHIHIYTHVYIQQLQTDRTHILYSSVLSKHLLYIYIHTMFNINTDGDAY